MPTENEESVVLTRKGELLTIVLNRPERHNALTSAMIARLATVFGELEEDPDARVVTLRGAGSGFSAGVDIAEYLTTEGALDRDNLDAGIARLPELVLAMRRCPQPIIALMHGAACGAGFALALAADVRIAGRSARMNDAFIRLGVSGCELGLSYFLPRIVGMSIASELMLTGRFIDAERAVAVGLVSSVVDDEELDAAGIEMATDMLAASRLGLRLTKETLRSARDVDDLSEVIALEWRAQRECLLGDNFGEGLQAFLAGRRAEFD
ncbi:hypothetical protein BAY59_26490 [Prauserella coralliicola]|nr:hypothetical protein BAY59_26490 [Prauserella coralliicola]